MIGKHIKPIRLICLILCTNIFVYLPLKAQVSGLVFQELPVNGNMLNTYGINDSNEPGIANVMVTITDVNGVQTNQITASDGTWSDPVTNFPVRVEFSWPNHPWLHSGPNGNGSNTSIQFLTSSSSSVNFGLHNSDFYSDTTNPFMTTVQHVNGTGVAGSTSGDTESLLSVRYQSTGLNADYTDGAGNQGTGPIPFYDASFSQTGTLWGVAYQKDFKRLFTSTMMRRHAGIKDGLGYIYVADYSAGMGNIVHSFDLHGLSPTNGGSNIDLGSVCRDSSCDPFGTGLSSDYELGDARLDPSVDLDAFGKVGVVGYGDIEYDSYSNKLWAVNLNQKALIQMDVQDQTVGNIPTSVNQYLLSSMTGLPVCSNGELRPWALKFAFNRGYLGLICDATGSDDNSDLTLYVLSFDPLNPTSFNTELFIPNMNYKKVDWGDSKMIFNAWMNIYDPNKVDISNGFLTYPQPLLMDIEFDHQRNMYLSIGDRFAYQLGRDNYFAISANTDATERAKGFGDIIMACFNGTGYDVEGSTGGCPVNFPYNEGGVSDNGEFFDNTRGDGIPDDAMGALAYLPGTDQIISTQVDPWPDYVPRNTSAPNYQDYVDANGVQTYSLSSGLRTNWYSFNRKGRSMFGKANGLGDLELLGELAPTEIGNFVWEDTDMDGEQDPGEAGISGVVVELYDAAGSALLATATTDANGNYIFSNDPNGTSTASHIYNIITLKAGMDYIVRFPATSGALSLTSVDATGNTLDSDANTTTGDASVSAAEVPISGANNHTFDAGYSMAVNCSSSLTASPGTCDPNTNIYTLTGEVTFSNDPGTGTIMVEVDGQTDVINLPTTSPASYTITGLTADGSSHTVTVTFSDDASCGSTTTYTAPASCTPNCSVSQTHSTECNDNGTSSMADDFFNLTVTGTVVNGSGNYIVNVNGYTSPSTASGSNVTIQGDGTHTNLAADGTSSYTVRVEDSNDNGCFIEFTVGPVESCSMACPPNEHLICDNDSNEAVLTAEAGLTGVIWYFYDDATMTRGAQVGSGSTLTVMGSDIGAAGSRQCYIYEGMDSQGCPAELCCPICLIVEQCCPDPNCFGINIITPTGN